MNGTASSSAGEVAIRLTPGMYVIYPSLMYLNKDCGTFIGLIGKSDDNNELDILLVNNLNPDCPSGDFIRASDSTAEIVASAGEWYYSKTASDGVDKSFVLSAVAPEVHPDTYVASVGAVTWAD